MQMHSSDTKAGVTICRAPSMIAVAMSLPISRCQLMFSMVTVASSTRMPTASARPPSVMTLIVSPSADRTAIEASTASGIDTVMISVERQLPRKSRIISPVSAAAMAPSRITPETAALTNTDWSPIRPHMDAGRQVWLDPWQQRLTPAMMSSVDADPAFWMVIITARSPSIRTMLVCGGLPSCT